MHYTGYLNKMAVYQHNPVRYYLNTENDLFFLNDLLGKKIKISYLHKIKCFCGKIVDSVYRMNFCQSCFFTLPQASDAILKPELSKAHLGIEERDLEFEKAYQLQPHTVYLAISGGLKVGVTRTSQQITRWIDQGAVAALPLLLVENRYQAGMWEVELKKKFSDKTAWREMLTWKDPDIDLLSIKEEVKQMYPDRIQEFSSDDTIYRFEYPKIAVPEKITSVNIEKNTSLEGELTALRGQYIVLNNSTALNIRTYEGRMVDIVI
ncbi:hypothetical protein JCM31826_05430 [Thermaurantimonas aggregans]|uniref:DUF2797 domain-containing protein n=2 Tax=Thermaurantimonas aggregans TaxID=2173829 RepID=A0A401XJA0_9FLAO|nr:hypothetical protein JCM31826_05430 [Thermaurantimonas aggregans]